MLKYLFIFCLLGAAWQFLNTRNARIKAANAAAAAAAAVEAKAAAATAKPVGSASFVPMPAPKNAAPDRVLVIVPPDCPREATLRAEAILAELRAASIPCQSAGQATFAVPTQFEADAVNTFMAGPLPLVFIGNMACANPAPADVVAEYRRTTPK